MKVKVGFAFVISLLVSILLYLVRINFSNSVPLIIFNIAGWLKLPGDLLVYISFGLVNPQKAWQTLHGVYPYFLINYLFVFLFYFFTIFIIFKIFKSHREKIKRKINLIKEVENEN